MLDWRLGIALAGITGGVLLQGPLGDANAERRRNDFRYTPDPLMARILSFGHRSTLADAMWLRALPDFARDFEDKRLKERWLGGVLDVVTDLDPTFYTAYSYGSTYLSLVNRQSDRAIALLERGVEKFDELEAQDGRQYPAQTRLLVDTAMAYWMYKKDRARTLAYLDRAVERPDCDFLTRNMRIGLALQEEDDLLALTYAAQLLEHQNPDVRQKAALDFAFTRRNIARREAREFAERAGRQPESVDEVRAAADLADEIKGLVFDGLVLDDDGVVQSPEYERLQLEQTLRSLQWAAAVYRREHGERPGVDWFYGAGERPNGPFVLPRRQGRGNSLPPGRTVAIDEDGTVRIVAADE